MGWVADWLELLARWAHLVVGAAWIGTSFYFNWLNNNIRPLEEGENPDGKLAGALWSVHGGAFYRVSKLDGAPDQLPETLHWFKWEAYLTWVSGVCLLLLVYWLQAGTMMVKGGIDLHPAAVAGIGVAALIVGWVVYDRLCKSHFVHHPRFFFLLGLTLLAVAAFGLTEVLSPRAAYIHFGAMLGTMMALNVFFVIIPGQRAMVDALIEGREPDLAQGKAGSLRSLHNNYFTLPVLFVMISNHYPFTYTHAYNWAVLLGVALFGVGVRHAFNLHGRGLNSNFIIPAAVVGFSALAFVSHGPKPADTGPPPPYSEVKQILEKRCFPCHTEQPTWPGQGEPGGGLLLNDPALVQQKRELIRRQVGTQAMPLGNVTRMTDKERMGLRRWLRAGAKTD